MSNVQNIKVEAMKVFFGADTKQVEKIKVPLGISKVSLTEKCFVLYKIVAGVISKEGYWFNVGGSDTAPSVADITMNEVDISGVGVVTAQDIAEEIQAVIDAQTAIFSATVSSNEVTVSHEVEGYTPGAHDALVTADAALLAYEILVQGDKEEDVGCIDGDIEVAFEESFIDVNCHAEGVTPVAQIKNGVSNVEVTLNLEETSMTQLRKMFTKTGGSFVPNNGSELFGMGTYKIFENMFKYATKLRLHPAALALTDKSRDLTFHKALPNLTGITFSGENVFMLPVTFKVFPAEGVNTRVNYFSYGDSSQSLT